MLERVVLRSPVFAWRPFVFLNKIKKPVKRKMSIKLILVIWSYHIVTLKLLHCNSIEVFFLCFYLSKHEIYKPLWWWPLNFWIINFWILWKNKCSIPWVKNYLLKIMKDVAVGILQRTNFGKYNMLFLAGQIN